MQLILPKSLKEINLIHKEKDSINMKWSLYHRTRIYTTIQHTLSQRMHINITY